MNYQTSDFEENIQIRVIIRMNMPTGKFISMKENLVRMISEDCLLGIFGKIIQCCVIDRLAGPFYSSIFGK